MKTSPLSRLIALTSCLLIGGLATGVSAQVTIDQQPLVVAKPLPPNIYFLMDDSGSMAWQHMPGTTATWSSSEPSGLPGRNVIAHDIRLRASNVNTQWYDPRKTYTPWKQWDGSSWGDINPANAPYDPSGEVQSGSFNLAQTEWPSVSVSSTSNTATAGSPNTNCEWVRIGGQWQYICTTTYPLGWRYQGFYFLDADNNNTPDTGQIAAPADTTNSQYKRYDFRWNAGNNRWEAQIHTLRNSDGASTSFTSLSGNTLSPWGRTVAQEVQNYANWFSYYRLRASMAKAAASRVFSTLSDDYRVGYNTIHNRQRQQIPVGTDDGLFRGANKQTWFQRLFNTRASSGTPLRRALDDAGQYFSSTADDGPWGPPVNGRQLSCRQNFTILTTDGYWNGDEAGTEAARADNDSTAGALINGPGGASYQYEPSTPYQDGRGNTLADVAMYYWKNDLRDLQNDVPTSTANPAFWQHMVTFGVSIGERGTLDPQSDLAALTSGDTEWPEPADDRKANIDDLWHAALNGRGEFIVAADSDAFVKGLTDALGTIADRLGSGASLAANSTRLDDENAAYAYQAQYWSGNWRGDLVAYLINPATGRLATEPTWRAAQLLNAKSPAARNIFVSTGLSGNNAYRSFSWDNLSNAQRTAINGSSIVSGSDATGADIIDYLRGVRALEITPSDEGVLRTRTSVLGDIVSSQPVYVGAPDAKLYVNADFTGASSHASFAAAQANRTPVIYVGANDGMLHGFNANTGEELFAFVPNAAIMNGIADIADPEYEHKYFVDGELTVADVFSNATGWRTVLIGTMGRSTPGIFALDVTDPANISFLWEKTNADIGALGQNLGKPLIVKLGNNNWKVLLGNGFNSTGGTAQLLMVDALSGSATAVSTAVSGNNALSAVVPWDSNGDGFTDIAYAGDRLGNLWRFSDLGGTPTVAKLFEARSSGGAVQPITAAPLVGRDIKTNQRWVFFGTGQYLNTSDVTSQAVQTWYGLIDDGTTITGGRSELVSRSIIAEGTINNTPARAISEGSKNDLLNSRGWYIDLISPANGAEGERMVTPNQFRGGALIGTTRIPDGSDPCNPSGRGYIMVIDPFTGARLSYSFFDMTRDGIFDEDDQLTVDGEKVVSSAYGFGAGPNNPIFVGNNFFISLDDGSTEGGPIAPPATDNAAVRRSWREILNQ